MYKKIKVLKLNKRKDKIWFYMYFRVRHYRFTMGPKDCLQESQFSSQSAKNINCKEVNYKKINKYRESDVNM